MRADGRAIFGCASASSIGLPYPTFHRYILVYRSDEGRRSTSSRSRYPAWSLFAYSMNARMPCDHSGTRRLATRSVRQSHARCALPIGRALASLQAGSPASSNRLKQSADSTAYLHEPKGLHRSRACGLGRISVESVRALAQSAQRMCLEGPWILHGTNSVPPIRFWKSLSRLWSEVNSLVILFTGHRASPI